MVTLILYVCTCVGLYEQEVTAEAIQSEAKKSFFFGISGFGHYNRQPTDMASYGPGRD